MRSFLQRGDISLRSQHAYYAAPSAGFIKTIWDPFLNELRERGESAERKFFLLVVNGYFEVCCIFTEVTERNYSSELENHLSDSATISYHHHHDYFN